jgi:hypothetical protein
MLAREARGGPPFSWGSGRTFDAGRVVSDMPLQDRLTETVTGAMIAL